MTDGLSDAAFFAAIVDAGGVSAGARATGSSPPAVSRRLACIERRLGVRLADRGSRRFRLTDEGALYLARCRELVTALRDAEAEVSSRGTSARGRLRVCAPVDFGLRRVAPLLATFTQSHPHVEAHLVLSDAGLQAGEDGLDVAIRVGLPRDGTAITRRLLSAPLVVCGSSSYFAGRGVPQTPADLEGHACLRLGRRGALQERWRFVVDGEERDVAVSGPLASDSGDALRCWALEGRGLSREALWDIEQDLATGTLVACLEAFACARVDLYATFLPGRPVPPRVRLFVDHLARSLEKG